MPYLIFCTGDEKEAIELNIPSETSIGRTNDNDITILDDSSVSRKHLLIKVDEGGNAFAEDLGSSNGTYVNNYPLSESQIQIPNGAIIKAGDAQFLLCYDNFESFADAPLPPLKLRFKDQASPTERENSSHQQQVYDPKAMLDTVMLLREDKLFEDHSKKLITAENINITKGQEIEGYRIIRDIGEGTFSKTYLAYQKSVDRTVALKIFRIIQDFNIEEVFEDFKNEILKTANIDDPRILHYFDCGFSSRIIFISMPYLPEGNLKDKIIKNGRFPSDVAVATITKIAEVLKSLLTNSNTSHLSIHPANIVYNDNDDMLITDYALKLWKIKYCIRNESAQNWTRYDSPELRNREDIDYHSDIFSLGILLCEMLTGIIADDKSFNLKSAIENCKASKELVSIIQIMTAPSKNLRVKSFDALLKMLNNLPKQKKSLPKIPHSGALKIKQYQAPRKIIIKQKK